MPSTRQRDTISSIILQTPSLAQFTVDSSTRIATLWSNYGSIDRVRLRSKSTSGSKAGSGCTVIVKTVAPPGLKTGDQADEGHLRKLLSYEVERFFYANLSSRLPGQAKVAHFHPPRQKGDEDGVTRVQIVLEDLAVEYPDPARGSLNLEDSKSVLSWLATFHGTFWGLQHEQDIRSTFVLPPLQHKGGNTAGVWEQGTYWYLDTRREELESTDEQQYRWLLEWLDKVDGVLKSETSSYGTLLHGDAKAANIVFSRDSSTFKHNQSRCALYDFQYAGVGLVTRDLVYFLGTTTQSRLLIEVEGEKELLRAYHADLMHIVGSRQEPPNEVHDDESTTEYSFSRLWGHWELAIVDWCRFMAGWGFWGNGKWVERRAKQIVSSWDTSGFPYD